MDLPEPNLVTCFLIFLHLSSQNLPELYQKAELSSKNEFFDSPVQKKKLQFSGKKIMGIDVLVNIDDLRTCSAKSICRICHEEESESLEAPCACTGTVKFAHRDCIQRWCNEKGNTVCEICLQKFEPGYTSQPKKAHLIDTTIVTIRGSLEIPRINPEQNVGEILETEYSECASAADRSAAFCRSVALILTALLLIRHLFDVFNSGAGSGGYPLSLPTLLIVKASGILLPMYVLLRVIAAIHNSIRHHHQQRYINILSSDDEDEGQDDNV